MKKIMIIGAVAMMFVCMAAIGPPEGRYSNLKVLPKNISSQAMSKIMVDEISDALGVSCGFCHAEKEGSHQLDYASDAKPEKEIARVMMRMTMRINKRYFAPLTITCNTCHNGQPHPDNVSEK